MKRILFRVLTLLLALSLLSFCSVCVFASAPANDLSGNPLVVDNAELLSASERTELQNRAWSISAAHGCEVIILTVNDAGWKTAQDYAEDYFVDHGYGCGTERSGIMLFLDMGERDYYIATHGNAIDAFRDNDILFLESRFLPDLKDGDYEDAFDTYLDYAEKILGVYDGTLPQSEKDALNEEFNNFMNGTESKPNYVRKGILSVILGALAGFLPVGAQKASLKTVRKRRDAAGYAREGSLNLDVNRDVYLYSNVTHQVIQSTPRTEGGGGHSIGTGSVTTHTHSSGTSFGGHGGKF